MSNDAFKIDVREAQGRRDGSYLTGKMLIAMPSLTDQRYRRNVILVYEHNDQGAKGFIVNRTSDRVSFLELTRQLNIACNNPPEPQLYQGGAVDNMRGFVLHSTDRQYRASLKIAEGLFLSNNIDPLNEIANRIGPRQRLILLGHTLWPAGSLEQELGNNDWLVSDCQNDIIFMEEAQLKWSAALDRMKINLAALSPILGES